MTRILTEATGLSIMDLERNTRKVLPSSMYKVEPYNYEFQDIKANHLPKFKYVSFDALTHNKDTRKHYNTSIFFYNVPTLSPADAPDLSVNPVRVSCSCKAYYFYFSYYNKMGGAHARRPLKGYTRKTPPPPDGLPYKNPDHLPGACKHIIAFAQFLSDSDYSIGGFGFAEPRSTAAPRQRDAYDGLPSRQYGALE